MTKVTLGGIEVDVVSNEEANEADWVVCTRAGVPTPFTDNVLGQCFMCDALIQWRPYMPVKPRRICMECALLGLGEPQ